jgi:hypothetical protein
MLIEPDIKVVGIHREILSTMNLRDTKIIDFWLNSKLGFTNKICPMPRDSWI